MAKSPQSLTLEGLKNDLRSAGALLWAIARAAPSSESEPVAGMADELTNLADSPIALALLHKAMTEGK